MASKPIILGTAGNDELGKVDWTNTVRGASQMVGLTGDDVYYVYFDTDEVVEAAGEGTDLVYSRVDFTLPDNVENLTLIAGGTAGSMSWPGNAAGTGNDLDNIITAPRGSNVLRGLGGNDMFDGNGGSFGGSDTLIGGTGDDYYRIPITNEFADDVIVELAGEGIDTIEISSYWFRSSYTLGENIENLIIGGTGNPGTFYAYGNDLDNVIIGNNSPTRIDGGLGADRMEGGLGDDIYTVDNVGDQVIEAPNAGIDRVVSSISYALSDDVEQLTLSGTGIINAIGNDGDNTIQGNAARNLIDGRGGADLMVGGAGNDTYIVHNVGDVVREFAHGGVDTIRSSISYTIPSFRTDSAVEILELTGDRAINGTGNEATNYIYGNLRSNVLDGGRGADRLFGGAGNDTYILDNFDDRVTELAHSGVDTVFSSFSYTLGDNLECLVLSGTANIRGTGNEANNIITGNAGANILDGGIGADRLAGGAGNDTYYVDNVRDTIIEDDVYGIDTVRSPVSFTLSANVENLILMGGASTTGTGNSGANTMIGGSAAQTLRGLDGADTLDGGGGADKLFGGLGQDSLTGGTGADGFYFDTPPSFDFNADTITDFSSRDDTIFLDRRIFSAITTDGALSESAFHAGGAPHDADDRIIYDQGSGNIFYDADGTGAGFAVLFARVDPGTTMGFADFSVYTGG